MSSYDVAQLARLEPSYLARYGLQTAPFSATHDDRFLYLDGERHQLLNMLQHLTQYSQLLLIVVGERGVGKTSLKQRFINNAGDDWLICEVNAHPMMDANELLSVIAQGFGLIDMPASPAELQNNLYRYLAGLQHNDAVPILLVDDAHELPQDALEALFYLSDAEASEGNLLRTVLFCEPAINVMLNSSAIQPLKERVTHTMEIPPFDEEQTAEYLKHRLAVAGLEGASPFSPRDIRRIHKASDGIPDKINEAAHLLLNGDKVEELLDSEDDYPYDDESAPRSLSLKYVAIGLVAVLIVGAVLYWQEEINRLFTETEVSAGDDVAVMPAEPDREATASQQPPMEEKTIELDVPEPGQEPAPPAEMEAAEPSVLPGHPDEPESAPQEAATLVPSDQEQPEQTERVSPGGADTAQAENAAESIPSITITSIEPAPVPASDKQQTLTLRGEGFDENTRITVEWANQRKTLPESRVEYVSESQLKFRITVGTTPETWVVIARNPQTGAGASTQFTVKPVATEKAPRPAAAEPGDRPDLAWLKDQPGEYFTLQLLASRQIANLRQFTKQHQLTGKTVIFESRNNGQPWYALAYGSFDSRQAAEQASRDLPAGIKPWIRQFASIQSGLVEQTSAPSIQDKSIPRSTNLRDHAAWLWDQNPSHYTLQLLAGRNEAAVKEFITRHNLQGEAVFYATRRDAKPWYVVVLGSYADRDAALAARQQLPENLRQQSPWPRSFSDVHAELYRN